MYITQAGIKEIKSNPQVYTTQGDTGEIEITLRYTLPKRVYKRLKVTLRYTLPKRIIEDFKN